MEFFIIFFCELALLFFLSRLVTRAVSVLLYTLFRHERFAIPVFAVLFFPGTLLHELSHFFMAVMLMVRVGHIEFIPKVHEGTVKLGSVQIAHTDPFRRALIGLAPMFVGLGCILTSLYYFSSFPLQNWYVNIVLLVIIIFEVGNTMFSSRKDVEGLPALLLALAVIGLLFYLSGVRIPMGIIDYIFSPQHSAFMKQLCVYMLVPIGVDAGVIGITRFLNKPN